MKERVMVNPKIAFAVHFAELNAQVTCSIVSCDHNSSEMKFRHGAAYIIKVQLSNQTLKSTMSKVTR